MGHANPNKKIIPSVEMKLADQVSLFQLVFEKCAALHIVCVVLVSDAPTTFLENMKRCWTVVESVGSTVLFMRTIEETRKRNHLKTMSTTYEATKKLFSNLGYTSSLRSGSDLTPQQKAHIANRWGTLFDSPPSLAKDYKPHVEFRMHFLLREKQLNRFS